VALIFGIWHCIYNPIMALNQICVQPIMTMAIMIPYQIFTHFYMCIQEIVQTVKMLVPFCQVQVHLHDFKTAVSMSVTILMELRMLESPWAFVNVRPSFRRMKHCNVHHVANTEFGDTTREPCFESGRR